MSRKPRQGTGLERKIASKTLWEWLTVLLVPLMIAALTIAVTLQQNAISQSQHESDQQIALANRQKDLQIVADQQQAAILKTYSDDMTDVMLNHGLRQSKLGDEVRIVARTKTLTALRQLDPLRKAFLIQFLYEAQLITITSPNDDNPIISLRDADLSGITLSSNIGLRRINVYANPDPNGVNHCNLNHIDLSGADLTRADLNIVNLRDARITGATMPNGRKYPSQNYQAPQPGP